MATDDRLGLMPTTEAKEGKLKATGSVLVHASVQTVSQVWQAGPLEVRLEERDGETWVLVAARYIDVLNWAVAVGLEVDRVVDALHRWGVLRWELRLGPVLDRSLVELVDVIADVRRAAGTVQMCFEDLDVSGGG